MVDKPGWTSIFKGGGRGRSLKNTLAQVTLDMQDNQDNEDNCDDC